MRRLMATIVVVMACPVVGCATSGVGTGSVEAPGKPEAEGAATFTWRADPDATRGTIEAVLPDGRVFRGAFLQVTSTTMVEDLGPYWGTAWGPGPYHTYTTPVRHYTGRVLAQLESARGERMRCEFRLARPADGPQSGGVGECETTSGERIHEATLRGED